MVQAAATTIPPNITTIRGPNRSTNHPSTGTSHVSVSTNIVKAIDYAKATNCRTIHTMAGLWPAGKPKAEGDAVYVENVRYAADLAPMFAAADLADLLMHKFARLSGG